MHFQYISLLVGRHALKLRLPVNQTLLVSKTTLRNAKQIFRAEFQKYTWLKNKNIKRLAKFTAISGTAVVSVSQALKLNGSHVICHGMEQPIEAENNVGTTDFSWTEFFKEYLLPEILPLGLAIMSALVGAFVNMKIPGALGDLINILNQQAQTGLSNVADYMIGLREPVIQLMALYLCQGFTTFLYISLLSHLGENVACKLRTNLFKSFLQQDVAFHDEHKTGELIDRLTSDVQDFKSSFKLCVSQGIRSSTQTIGCICSLYSTSPKLTLALAATIPLIVLIGTFVGIALRRLSRLAQKHAAEATGKANEVVANFRTVRAFANEPLEARAYEELLRKSQNINQYLGIGIGAFQGITNIALNGIVLGVIYVGGYLMSVKEINPGQLMSFLVSAQMIQRSLASLSVLSGTAVRGVTAGGRVFEYIHKQPSIPTHGGRIIPYHCLLGHLKFDDVHFTYPQRRGHEVLKGISLDIKPCQTVALCGLSGAGKSTVASLVERFYDPTSGKVMLDGVNILELDPSWLRGKAIGYINQEPVLFSGSVEENIKYGNPEASKQEVIKAAKLANADSFIQNFPDGYNTIVGERGVALSGGQKQRIAIARALLKNPSILILDEATSALDAESERLVQDALDHVMVNRTVLVIAHRLSTIKNADVIAVMKGGKVVEVGNHKDLKKKGGIYSELIKLQESNE
ncbi:mitochondrial potassium channel ATP-binding subunit-like isoform X1 [Ciona intestinalis]